MTADDSHDESEPDGLASPEDMLRGSEVDQTQILVPPLAKMAVEIQPLRNYQDFQRACVVLFQAELKDPHVQEYGRSGQKQHGLDIFGYRDGNPDHPVAIQCRRVVKPMKKAKIESDCRDALALEPALREIVFATTAPDDTHAANDARDVEKRLRSEGHQVRIVLYGWGQLQLKIALYPVAYAVFTPASMGSSAPVATSLSEKRTFSSSEEIVEGVLAGLRQSGIVVPADEPDRQNWHLEDPALHARIDTYRDLFNKDRQIDAAKNGLAELLPQADPTSKPWARFRIQTNLASIAVDLGREAEAIAHFEAAHAIKPSDAHAVANLALARTIGGRFEEAIEAARQALSFESPPEGAVAYLLQAAARSSWRGNPEKLVPQEFKGTVAADIGLADFFRRRELRHWPERVIELAKSHPDSDELQRIKAMAVLAIALEDERTIVGGRGCVSRADLDDAANVLVAACERYLAIGFADKDDLAAFLNNAAVLLRLAGRHAEAEALLKKGLRVVPNAPTLPRLMALSLVALGRIDEAIAAIDKDIDPETRLLHAELVASHNPNEGMALLRQIRVKPSNSRLEYMRWRVTAELAIRVGDFSAARKAIKKLGGLSGYELVAEFLEIRLDAREKTNEDSDGQRLVEFSKRLPNGADFLLRYEVADALDDFDQPSAAASLLEGHVDLGRPSHATRLYLRTLASARRDEEFRKAVDQAPDEVRDDPQLLWGEAAHAWNMGDLDQAEKALDRLISLEPKNGPAQLLRIEILVRCDRAGELLTELDKPVEQLHFARLEDSLRLARLLAHFGQLDRGAALAYRLFLLHRDVSSAWMALSAIILDEGRAEQGRWTADLVGMDSAVNIRFSNGEERLFVVEADAELRKIDPESVEPDHPLVRRLWGLAANQEFKTDDGRDGTIIRLRHKLIARFHYILERHADRFPEVSGFRKINIDTSSKEGLAPIIEVAKARQEWVEQQQATWAGSNVPLAVLAQRLGTDVLELAGGLAQNGQALHVAEGTHEEQLQAVEEILRNNKAGCTLELHSFWTAWRLKALDTITALCGQVHVAQSVLDDLRVRRERFSWHSKEGLKSAGYKDGKLVLHEVAPEAVQTALEDMNQAITWLEQNGKICPPALPTELPELVREALRALPKGIFDDAVVALRTNTLLISDDLVVRSFLGSIIQRKGAWSQIVLQTAYAESLLELDDYVRMTANIIEAGHAYIGTNGEALASAARIDNDEGATIGYNFRMHAGTIGGPAADSASHFAAVRSCLEDLWDDRSTESFRQPVSGHLIRQLVHGRSNDFGILLRSLFVTSRDRPQLHEYVSDWIRGHFIPPAALQPTSVQSPPRTRAEERRAKRNRGK